MAEFLTCQGFVVRGRGRLRLDPRTYFPRRPEGVPMDARVKPAHDAVNWAVPLMQMGK